MKLTSSAFGEGGQIPTRYTCDGEDVHPPLEIEGAPKGVQSFAILMEDEDAMDGDWHWLHWTMWNLSPHTTIIKEGKVPEGVIQGKTSEGTYHYTGPYAPKGVHRYRFTLYALDTELNVPADVTAEELKAEMDGYVLAEAELTGTYSRNGEAIWKKHTEEELGSPPPAGARPSPLEPGYIEEEWI